MKKLYSLFIIITVLSLNVAGSPVSKEKAKQIGETFLINSAMTPGGALKAKSNIKYDLIYKATANQIYFKSTENKVIYQEIPLFYIFGAENNGFVIVSGDDSVIPILGYSENGSFDPSNIPPNMQKWLEGYKSEIRYIVENNISATEEIKAEWENSGRIRNNSQKSTVPTVNPLIKTKWNQSPYYNKFCPYDYGASDRTVVGCVVTAMAQVMKFWEHPKQGVGYYSYSHSKYGTLFANFGSTIYDWKNMPNALNSSSSSTQVDAVATLMYQCGVSVEMNYNVGSAGGSGATVTSEKSNTTHCVEYALKTYFGYKDTLKGIQRVNYSQSNWINLLKSELDSGRPIIYAGFGSGGHCFIVDGYAENDFFHINWGWGGKEDLYFRINELNPQSRNYNSSQQAIIGVEPTVRTSNFQLTMYDDLSISPLYNWFGDAIYVTANIANYGTDVFNGEFIAAAFDSNGYFLDFLSPAQSHTIYPNNFAIKTFSHKGGPPFIPGKYYIAICYRNDDGDWKIVSENNNTYYPKKNIIELKVNYSSTIETNSNFKILDGSTTLKQSQKNTIIVDALNTSVYPFYGKILVALSDLKGYFVQFLGEYDLSAGTGLPPNHHFIEELNFTQTINVQPGTYLLGLYYQNNGDEIWYYAGSTKFQNPTYVVVEAPPIQPDSYESNNSKDQAKEIPLYFVENFAKTTTVNSNFHIGSDVDFYKMILQEGYDYSVNARLHDSYKSGNGQTYSADALFSLSLDNTNLWSSAYDDVMGSNININNGGTLYFYVSPYFFGSTGSYMLDISLTRNKITDANKIDVDDQILIYPNPAKDFATIDIRNVAVSVDKIELIDLQGRNCYILNEIPSKELINLPLTDIPKGVYFLKIYSNRGVLAKKLIVEK